MAVKFLNRFRKGSNDDASDAASEAPSSQLDGVSVSRSNKEFHPSSVEAGTSIPGDASSNVVFGDGATPYDVNEMAQRAVEKADEVRTDHWYDGFVRLFIWYPSYMPKDEKLMLLKIDVVLLLYVCASYFTKALDKSNITKAYNANMDKDIGFGGDDLSYAKSLYSAGYIISMFFGTIMVTRPKARLMLPLLETIWGVLTFCQAACNTPSQIFAMRFLIGLAEGPIFPSVVYTIGSWYKRDEVYRRIMAFSISSSLGGMFSGFLQAAAYTNLSGKGGLSGWKWGFIIDGIITVPIALLGFICYPGSLDQARNVWWLKKEELVLARTRMISSGVKSAAKLKLSILKNVFTKWHVHYFTAMWVLLNVVALPDGVAFDLFLKSRPDLYSVEDRENYPSIQSAVSVGAQFLCAGLSDTFSPYYFLTLAQILFIISYSSIIYWDIPVGYKWFCYMMIGFDNVVQAIISGQINRALRRNAEERAFVIAFSDAVSQAMNIWTNIVFFPTSDAPQFRNGFIASLTAALLMLFLPIINYYGDRYDKKKYAMEDLKNMESAGEVIDGSSLHISGDEAAEKELEKDPYKIHQKSVAESDSNSSVVNSSLAAPNHYDSINFPEAR